MILITGAAGKTGRAVAGALKGKEIRALIHRQSQLQEMYRLGFEDVIVGDMGAPAVLRRAFAGIRAVYHICPNVSPDELAIGRSILAAAREAAVQHFCYHSVLHPLTESMPHHWQKMRVEEQILLSGLPFTILRPAAYMQNIFAQWDEIKSEGVYAVPYSPDTRISLVDLADVAEVAAKVLTETGHAGAAYDLCSHEFPDQKEVARLLEKEIGRSVQAKRLSRDAWTASAVGRGMGAYQVQALIKMFQYYEKHGFRGNGRVLEFLMGRPPAKLSEVIQRSMRDRAATP